MTKFKWEKTKIENFEFDDERYANASKNPSPSNLKKTKERDKNLLIKIQEGYKISPIKPRLWENDYCVRLYFPDQTYLKIKRCDLLYITTNQDISRQSDQDVKEMINFLQEHYYGNVVHIHDK